MIRLLDQTKEASKEPGRRHAGESFKNNMIGGGKEGRLDGWIDQSERSKQDFDLAKILGQKFVRRALASCTCTVVI